MVSGAEATGVGMLLATGNGGAEELLAGPVAAFATGLAGGWLSAYPKVLRVTCPEVTGVTGR